MIRYNNRRKPLTGHRYDTSENLTAIAEFPLTGHRKRHRRDSDSWVEHPLTGHRHKHTIIRQESGTNEIVPYRPNREPHIYRNNSTRVVLSLQSVGIVESSSSSSTKDAPSSETFSIFTGRNLMGRGATAAIASTDSTSVVTSIDENLPIAESQVSLYSHRRSTPCRSLSLRSERSSFHADRGIVKALHGGIPSTSFDRSPIRSGGVRSRPISVCTESSTNAVRPRLSSASTEMGMVTLIKRDRIRFEDENNGLNGSAESLELSPLESARLQIEDTDLEFKSNGTRKDRERKTKSFVSLTQTKTMFQNFGDRLRKSLRRSKSNMETRSKPELRESKCLKTITDSATQRPASFHVTGNDSPALSAIVKTGRRLSSASALSKMSENSRCIGDSEKSASLKSIGRNSVTSSNVSDKTARRSFLQHSKSSLNASKEAIKNTYVNLVAPVKFLSKDDSRLEDIARSKENTRKTIRHANSNLESVNLKAPLIIQSATNSLEKRKARFPTTEHAGISVENAGKNSSKSKMDLTGMTIKRLEDKPSGRGSDVIEAYIPENENMSTFNGIKQALMQDLISKTPPLLPSYRPPPMNSEPVSTPSSNSSKSNHNGCLPKNRNSSDLSVSSFEDNENQPGVALTSSLKRRSHVSKRPNKKRTNTERQSDGCFEITTSPTMAEIECPNIKKDPDKIPSVLEQNQKSVLNNTSRSSTPTASNGSADRILIRPTLDKRRKFMYSSDRKGLHEPIPVPPPIPGTLKPGFRPLKTTNSDQSLTNSNASNGHISIAPHSQAELTALKGKRTAMKTWTPTRSSASDMSESGLTPTHIRRSANRRKSGSRPVSSASTISCPSNDVGANVELLLNNIVSRRVNQNIDSAQSLTGS